MDAMDQTSSRTKRSVKRYWVGWSSRHESVETPYPKWKTRASRVGIGKAEPGSTFRFNYAAVVDADDRESAWHEIARLYSDAEELFVREKETDFWPPVDRFPRSS